jgi:hypothetical protein
MRAIIGCRLNVDPRILQPLLEQKGWIPSPKVSDATLNDRTADILGHVSPEDFGLVNETKEYLVFHQPTKTWGLVNYPVTRGIEFRLKNRDSDRLKAACEELIADIDLICQESRTPWAVRVLKAISSIPNPLRRASSNGQPTNGHDANSPLPALDTGVATPALSQSSNGTTGLTPTQSNTPAALVAVPVGTETALVTPLPEAHQQPILNNGANNIRATFAELIQVLEPNSADHAYSGRIISESKFRVAIRRRWAEFWVGAVSLALTTITMLFTYPSLEPYLLGSLSIETAKWTRDFLERLSTAAFFSSTIAGLNVGLYWLDLRRMKLVEWMAA